MDTKRIRNFCIIAHIDHGKSTLADRFIEKAALVDSRTSMNQILDNMDIERERGITIKSQAVTLRYKAKDGQEYVLNLVDTPGHVDFSYEVSRAISSCEGALLLIDATQGVEAQTLANMYMAIDHNLEIIPVINKIDLPSADIESVKYQIDHDLGLDSDMAVLVSAKTGQGVDELFEAIIQYIPAPPPAKDDKLRALIFDSHYDPYRGVIVNIRVFSGMIKAGQTIKFMISGGTYRVEETGLFKINLEKNDGLNEGDVGYINAGIKNISDVHIGDTITLADDPASDPLEGFKEVKPVVFSSIYPVDSNDYEELLAAIEKLKLNDASLIYEKDSSSALGFSPSVMYNVYLKSGEMLKINNPMDFPDPVSIDYCEEPYIAASIITPSEYLGPIMTLCMEKRGVQTSMNYLDQKRVEVIYDMPLAEVLFDFYDRLKSISRGYASFDYEIQGFKPTNLVKLDILVNGSPVDALSMLVFKDSAVDKARHVCKKLCDEIPRHQFKIPIQGAIGSTIIARETISAYRKDVTAKCYGGDISRKRKLLEKQKEGKKRMKVVGNVELPQSAFLAVLKTEEND